MAGVFCGYVDVRLQRAGASSLPHPHPRAHQVRLLKGPPTFEDPLAFDGLSLTRHLDEDSLPSSDEELLGVGVGVGVGAALQDPLYPLSPRDARFFRSLDRPAKDSEGSSDSDADELATPYSSQGLDN